MKKIKNTKVYAPNFLSYALNDDQKHLKVWKEKIQENKDVQQKKQIDKILQGVIKERMFGDIISKQVKDSPSCYYTIDQISKSQINSSANLSKSARSRASSIMQLEGSRQTNYLKQRKQQICQRFKLHQSKQQNSAVILVTPRKKSKQIKLPALTYFSPKATSTEVINPHSSKYIQRSESIRSMSRLKFFQVIKTKAFGQFFRELSDNYTTPIIFDVKLSQEKLISKNKTKIPQKILQKLFYFFNFPQTISYKQYCNWVQKVLNMQLKLINFFVFSILDESSNGFLTISDLFKLMQNFPQNKYIEEEVFHIRNQILKLTKVLQLKSRQERMFKPTIEEMIISNHNLDLEQVKSLLKQEPSNNLIKSSIPKVSIYQNSIIALEHDVNIRLKQAQIESEQQNNLNKKKKQNSQRAQSTQKTISPDKNLFYQQGMKFSEFNRLYRQKRPKLFCLIIGILTGQKQSEYE